MNNETKQYILRIILIGLFATIVGVFINFGNYIVPLLSFFVLILILIYFRRIKQKTEIITDERIMKVGGKAASYVFTIFAFGLAIVGLIFNAMGQMNAYYFQYGQIFSLISCLMIFSYLLLYKYFNKKEL
ncbi:MAG: DUF2178 domain-containing protein [Candidatus ainarchaeum sp.]|nr:DUF2178 domain-containing protein [Candidatus ainarchaeum sp.]